MCPAECFLPANFKKLLKNRTLFQQLLEGVRPWESAEGGFMTAFLALLPLEGEHWYGYEAGRRQLHACQTDPSVCDSAGFATGSKNQ